MKTERDRLIEILAGFAGPLGPFVSLDEHMERKQVWVESVKLPTVDLLLDILMDSPEPKQLLSASREDFEDEISELLRILAKRSPQAFIRKIEPFLDNDDTKKPLIEALGATGSSEAVELLGPFVEDTGLAEEARISLAGALGELGGDKAERLLKRMAALNPDEAADLRHEIDLALQNVQR